ncbi:hypothetical protein BK138_18940 [Paenibacillus rhizosphaerae]|uniref:HTH marR-type domain-containing protein n=3 Tax=Paenibacillus TaxID=44249 RepID=A0A1R1EN45_9BACL|nr:hypothetical protein BK138_18940 [Paenibacillus rhizosphaerae]OXL88225.1 hypothetical protein BCV73_30580 [Paenibacillus sp. SSG-1]
MRFNRGEFRHRVIEGLKMSEMGLMVLLMRHVEPDSPGLKVSEISAMLGVTSPTVTQFVKALEKKKWIVRTPDEADRRVVRIKLSEEGREAIIQARKATIHSFKGLVDHLGIEESEKLSELLTKAYKYYESKTQNDSSDGGEVPTC